MLKDTIIKYLISVHLLKQYATGDKREGLPVNTAILRSPNPQAVWNHLGISTLNLLAKFNADQMKGLSYSINFIIIIL